LNFLEAVELNKNNSSGECISCSFFMSGLSSPLELYIKGYFSIRGINATLHTIPFNSLHQHVISLNKSEANNIFLIFPWDLLPEINWRSGFATFKRRNINDLNIQLVNSLEKFNNPVLFYIPALFPPIFHKYSDNVKLSEMLRSTMLNLDSKIIESKFFSLSSYLNIGCPVGNSGLSAVSEMIVDGFIAQYFFKEKKVLVTDFDGVLWNGIIGDDGIDGIYYDQSIKGYIHYIYQTYMLNLKDRGILICGVSRNSDNIAKIPFEQGDMVLSADDFVSILASYNSKSEQLKLLSENLNLNLDSFVFVDDSMFEIKEVSSKLKQVECLKFPSSSDDFLEFIAHLSSFFDQKNLTNEDEKRTDLYKKMTSNLVPRSTTESNLHDFLLSMEMKLIIKDRTNFNYDRALQLINKTNQFNMNGVRQTNDSIRSIIISGGSIYTASLYDVSGGHGEILACLVDHNGVVKSFVMSCRVFQRKLEYIFVGWLYKHMNINGFDYQLTDRNNIFKNFIFEDIFVIDNSIIFNSKSVETMIKKYENLIDLSFES
jgi:FkbH-like protein